MISSNTQKILIGLVVFLVLGFLGYKLFMSEPVIPENVDGTVVSDTTSAGQDILDLVDKLNNISIDQDFFSSALFSRLTDFSQIIFPEVRGRVNPFAPIGSDGPLSVNT